MKSMYQPGGARLRLLVIEAVSDVLVFPLIGTSTSRCSVSQRGAAATEE
jgi:hypothetical protein